MDSPIKVDREILGGRPCLAGTRVPVRNLFDYVAAGYPLEEFLRQFPSVTREQAVAGLGMASDALGAAYPGWRGIVTTPVPAAAARRICARGRTPAHAAGTRGVRIDMEPT